MPMVESRPAGRGLLAGRGCWRQGRAGQQFRTRRDARAGGLLRRRAPRAHALRAQPGGPR
eukprot:15073755-Alexandrium_andersonii.AAC.1